jgi:hypothetical protein
MDGRAERIALVTFLGYSILAGGNAVGVRFSNQELDPFWGATLRLAQLRPGGMSQRLSADKASRMLGGMRNLDPINEQRRAMAKSHLGDIGRFASADHYALYNGTAPIEVSSGGKKRHRLSMRGNRKLNHAIHMAAITQIRHPRVTRTARCAATVARSSVSFPSRNVKRIVD